MYIPVAVKKKVWQGLIVEARGFIFHRQDESGQYWVKAALKYGRECIEKYHGLKAIDN